MSSQETDYNFDVCKARGELLSDIDRLLMDSPYWQGGRFDTIKFLVDQLNVQTKEVERLRTLFLECGHCNASLLEPNTPPHCLDCVLTEEDYEEWENR